MKRFLPILLAAALHASGQGIPKPGNATKPPPAPSSPSAAAEPDAASSSPQPKSPQADKSNLQDTVDRLTKTNQELLDLMDRQQKVLEDMQVDRRLQSRQISLLEQRLEETLRVNNSLQSRISKLEAEAASPTEKPAIAPNSAPTTTTNAPGATVTSAPPPPPASYLPQESPGGALGTMWWHRVLVLSGDDMQSSKIFHIEGKQWRVLWHNQDRPGDAYKNTSALFINAFRANDIIPKRVCSKLGTGGDATELSGTGDFSLKIEASGGHWELAVEDFR